MWGPKFEDMDTKHNDDLSILYSSEWFSTYKHENIEDCPAYEDESKRIYKEAIFQDGKANYPCNIGGCMEGCPCIPCNDPERYEQLNSFKCHTHNPDHPDMFDESEDLALERRLYFEVASKKPIFKRPRFNNKLHPPKIKFAKMKKNCKSCKMIFIDHRKNHHILHPACQLCNHMKSASEKSFALTCYACLKTFKNKYRLKDHMHLHDDDNPFYCDLCKEGFTRRCNLEHHNNLYHAKSSEIFKCNECDNEFSSKSNFKRHMSTIHAANFEEFHCTMCDKVFNRHDNLLKHETVEHNFKKDILIIPGVNDNPNPFECSYCPQVYKHKFSLIRHIESKHAAEKVHQCNVCGNCYNRKDVLQVHARTHNIRILCEVCRLEFPTKHELRIHRIKTHDS